MPQRRRVTFVIVQTDEFSASAWRCPVTDCSHTGLIADCSPLTAQRNWSSAAVGLMSACVLAGCNQSMQIVAVDHLGRCPLGHRALVNMIGVTPWRHLQSVTAVFKITRYRRVSGGLAWRGRGVELLTLDELPYFALTVAVLSQHQLFQLIWHFLNNLNL